MAATVLHSYQNTVVESGSGGSTGVVGPNEWNAAHVIYADVNTQVGTTYAISAAGDLGSLVTFNNAAAVAVSIAAAISAAITIGTAVGFNKGWGCWVRNLGVGLVTITPATSTIGGATTLKLYTGDAVLIVSDGVNYQVIPIPASVSFNTGQAMTTAQQGLALANIGAAQNVLINGKIVESHTSGVATFSIKTLAGADPTVSDPVGVAFPDGSQVLLTAALSVNSANSYGTFGTANAISFRLWFSLINNAGTIVMGLRNCLNPTTAAISGFPGNGVDTTYTGNNIYGATWANGVAATAKPFVIIGLAEYDGGLVTAGAYVSPPSRIIMFGQGIKKPGDIVKVEANPSAATFTTTSASYVASTLAVSLTPTSRQNPVRYQANAGARSDGGNTSGTYISAGNGGVAFGVAAYLYLSIAGANQLYVPGSVDSQKLFDTLSTLSLNTLVHGDNGTSLAAFPAQTGSGTGQAYATEYMG